MRSLNGKVCAAWLVLAEVAQLGNSRALTPTNLSQLIGKTPCQEPYWGFGKADVLLSMCPVGTQGQKGTGEGKVFYTFKSRGSFVAAFYTQDAQQFSCLWQSFYGQRELF